MKGKPQSNSPKSAQKKKSTSGKSISKNSWFVPLALIGILLLSFLIYLPILHNEFLAWDDTYYIQDNPLIYGWNLKDIFSKMVMGNYHPLTILVLTIEYHLFGLNETGFHAINLLLHLANILLVFQAIQMFSGKPIPALIAALLFGIHPIHVESVAWAAELKDLLYTFFFLISIILYLKYLSGQQKKFLFFALITFLLSLLSKGMAASLPVVLVLIDFYKHRGFKLNVWLEKIPFFILASVLGFYAVIAQKSPLIVQDITPFTFIQRIAFACYSFFTYIAKLIVPIRLSAYYPYPLKVEGSIPFFYYGYILLLVLLISAIIYSLRTTRIIFFGIGFYAITVFLVLQLLPVGDAIMADRYSYVPSIGIFFLCGEGLMYLWNKNLKWIMIPLVALSTIIFAITTNTRCKVWKSDFTLWDDALSKFHTIPLAYYNRGLAYMNLNQFDEAVLDYNKAIELKPGYNEALVNRGNIFRSRNKSDEALMDYNTALADNPNFSKAYFNRGILYMNQQRNEEAISDFSKSIEHNPAYYKAYSNRGVIYNNEKRYADAISDYTKAIEIKPDYVEAYYNRAMSKYSSGDKEGACNDLHISADLGFQTAVNAIPQICNQ